MKKVIFALVILLIVLRHDFWFWDNSDLLMGFLPVALAYHIGISIAAAGVWFLATVYAWPGTDDSQ